MPDPARVGLGLQAFVRVQLARHEADAVAGFTRRVNQWDEVIACHALTGEMDYLLHVPMTAFLRSPVSARTGQRRSVDRSRSPVPRRGP